MHDDHQDADRYDSAAGWDPDAPRRKAAAQRIARDFEKNDPGFNPFYLSPGRAATAGPPPKPPAQLFGPLWHEGELAILFAPASAGKSILAVQIAAHIAGGKESFFPIEDRKSKIANRKVLYFDFERTPAQFTERYSAPHPLPSKLPLRHRFPANFIRADLAPPFDVPARFRGDMHRYLLYWLRESIEETGARVVVIDNLSYIARTLAGRSGASLIKTLKLWSTEYDLSILAVTHAKPARGAAVAGAAALLNSPPGLRRGGTASVTGWCSAALKPASLTDLAGSAAMADLADSVFHLSPSLLAPDLRYIKHLKSRRAPLLSEDGWKPLFGGRGGADQTVITCQLDRSAGSTPVLGGVAPASGDGVVDSSPTPFLAFHFLGPTPESVHLTDAFAPSPARTEKRITQTPHPDLPKPRSQMTTVEMLLSREYWRYLER